MIRVLLSAYACEPNRGSEPGVGWEWATRLACEHDVTVLTRANNRQVIEDILGSEWKAGQPRFIYHDLPRWILALKKSGIFPVAFYYLLWQLTASFQFGSRSSEFQIIHHVTFNGFRFPGAWWTGPIPVILGPLGGASIARSKFKRCFGSRWILEQLRGLTIQAWRFNPWTSGSLRNAVKVFVVGEEMVQRFKGAGIASESMLETALPQILEDARAIVPVHQRKDFVLVGNLEPWKAWQIVFEAFHKAMDRCDSEARLKVIGTGRQMDLAKKLAHKIRISKSVDFLGQLSRDRTWQIVEKSRGLLFPSIRDTSGNVVLEAMGLHVPVVCFNHQGVGFITDDACAIRIPPEDWVSAVEGFRDAIIALRDDDRLVEEMGRAGRARVTRSFTWSSKISRMTSIYQDVIEEVHQAQKRL